MTMGPSATWEVLSFLRGFRRYWPWFAAVGVVFAGLGFAVFIPWATKDAVADQFAAEGAAGRRYTDSAFKVTNSRIDTLQGIVEWRDPIIRGIGVDFCERKSDEWLASVGIPCDSIMAPIRHRRR